MHRYVFGGITQKGPTSELWAYDLMSQAWALTVSAGPSPPDGGWGIMCVTGYRVWVFSQQWDPVNGINPGTGQLWAWAPTPFTGPRGGGGASTADSPLGLSIAYGHTGGIVLGLLLGLANLFVLVRLAQNARVDLGCGLGGAKGGAGAYYTAAPSGIASAYEAPSA